MRCAGLCMCVCGDKYGYFAHLLSVFLVISEGGKNKMPILLSVLFMGE